jgi:diguanylate cyclase (GGDEF)-like protein
MPTSTSRSGSPSSSATGRDFALAIVDLDYFKRINDDFSHDAGDEVLRAVRTILAERCRETDLVARYGGEEFLLCFPQADLAAANEACEKIRMAVESTEWGLLVPGARVTLSAGVATMRSGPRAGGSCWAPRTGRSMRPSRPAATGSGWPAVHSRPGPAQR